MFACSTWPVEPAQALHHFPVIAAGQNHFLKIGSSLGVNRKFFQIGKEHVPVTKDNGEAIVEIVSDSAGHGSECAHSLLLNDLLLSRSQFQQRLFQIGSLLL